MGQESKLECEICGATFRDSDALAKHVLIHEKSTDEGKLEQGTQPPTENPTIPPMVPGPMRWSRLTVAEFGISVFHRRLYYTAYNATARL